MLSLIHFIVTAKNVQQRILLKLLKMVSFKVYHDAFVPNPNYMAQLTKSTLVPNVTLKICIIFYSFVNRK